MLLSMSVNFGLVKPKIQQQAQSKPKTTVARSPTMTIFTSRTKYIAVTIAVTIKDVSRTT